MNIKLVASNVYKDEQITKTIDINSSVNIIEACYEIDNENVGMVITFNSYYHRCYEMMMADDTFPFMIINGAVHWNVPFSDVSVEQFLNTHPSALSNGIIFEYGYAAAGGPGWLNALDIILLWAPLVWKTAVMLGEAKGIFKTVEDIILWFKEKFKGKSEMPYPQSFTDYIYYKDIWNHYDLADQLEINIEQAKMFLKAYGYNWSWSKHAYIVDENIKQELIEKENKINYLDK